MTIKLNSIVRINGRDELRLVACVHKNNCFAGLVGTHHLNNGGRTLGKFYSNTLSSDLTLVAQVEIEKCAAKTWEWAITSAGGAHLAGGYCASAKDALNDATICAADTLK